MDALARIKQTRLPFAELLGIEVVSASPDKNRRNDRARGSLHQPDRVAWRRDHGFCRPLGAMGTIVNVPQGAGTTTIESKTNFVAPARCWEPGWSGKRQSPIQVRIHSPPAESPPAPRHGTGRDRPRGPEICFRARARLRLLDAGEVHHHGARERRLARGRSEGRRTPRPGTTKLYDRRGYNPEKETSFFATY